MISQGRFAMVKIVLGCERIAVAGGDLWCNGMPVYMMNGGVGEVSM